MTSLKGITHKKLGEVTVERLGDTGVRVTFPQGIYLQNGDTLTIEWGKVMGELEKREADAKA